MAMPVSKAEVERVLRPWLGTLFLSSCTLGDILTERLSAYAPYRQTLEAAASADLVVNATPMGLHPGEPPARGSNRA